MEDVIAALATAGAGALLSAAGTDAWNTARSGIAKLFSRRGARASEIIDRRLDELADLAALDGHGVEQARSNQLSRWADRLEDLLEEHPDVAAELEDVISETESRLLQISPTRNEQRVEAGGHSSVWAVNQNQGNINVYHPQAPKETDNRPSAEIHFFTLGCAVGNGLAVLPLGDLQDDNPFEEFLAALRSTGADAAEIGRFRDLKRIINNRATPQQGSRRALEDYGRAIQALIDKTRIRASGDEFRWFTVGKLLYGIAVHQFLPSGKDRELRSERNALSGIAQSMNMPPNLRAEVVSFAATVSDDPAMTLLKANEIAQTCYAYL